MAIRRINSVPADGRNVERPTWVVPSIDSVLDSTELSRPVVSLNPSEKRLDLALGAGDFARASSGSGEPNYFREILEYLSAQGRSAKKNPLTNVSLYIINNSSESINSVEPIQAGWKSIWDNLKLSYENEKLGTEKQKVFYKYGDDLIMLSIMVSEIIGGGIAQAAVSLSDGKLPAYINSGTGALAGLALMTVPFAAYVVANRPKRIAELEEYCTRMRETPVSVVLS